MRVDIGGHTLTSYGWVVKLTKVFYLWRVQIWANFRKTALPIRQIDLKITQPLNLAMKENEK